MRPSAHLLDRIERRPLMSARRASEDDPRLNALIDYGHWLFAREAR